MLDFYETIAAFRRGSLDIDCKRMVLTQHKKDGEWFEGQGYIRQADDGALNFKIYVEKFDAKPLGHLRAMFGGSAGKLHTENTFYDLEAVGRDNERWTAEKILPAPHWDFTDRTVLMGGKMQSMAARLDMPPQKEHHLVLHYFQEYLLPLNRPELEASGIKFEMDVQQGSEGTVFEIASDADFPPAFELRIQEAIQYITGKSAFWRARLQSSGGALHLELASPWRKSTRTQFSPPISPISVDFHHHGWRLFEKYFSYIARRTDGTHWHPMAYHLYNACEATGGSVDTWAAGVSIAVEAIASLVEIDTQKDERLALYQERALAWLAGQTDLADIAERARGQINGMSQQTPKDKLYALAETGHVEKDYIKAWSDLRNRHLHPTLKDMKKPDSVNYQQLLDQIHQTETLLRQVTFYLIGYEGPFTDFGVHGEHGFPSKQYPFANSGTLKRRLLAHNHSAPL